MQFFFQGNNKTSIWYVRRLTPPPLHILYHPASTTQAGHFDLLIHKKYDPTDRYKWDISRGRKALFTEYAAIATAYNKTGFGQTLDPSNHQ